MAVYSWMVSGTGRKKVYRVFKSSPTYGRHLVAQFRTKTHMTEYLRKHNR